MNITLDSNPSDAPCCVKLVADDGRDVLIQTDWDYPAIASVFGWSVSRVENGDTNCEHDDTDGTIDCPRCKATASMFIQSAREWIDDNDGAEAEDPGYFD